jgi:signal transduction histidine kinase
VRAHAISATARSYLERARSGGVRPQPVVLPVLLILSIGSISRWLSSGIDDLTIAFRGVVFAALISWLFVFVGAILLRLIPARFVFTSGVLFFALFGFAEMVRAIVLAKVLLNNHVVSAVLWVPESVSAFTTGLALYSLAAFFVGDSRAYRNEVEQLLRSREQLQHALGSLKLDIQSRRDDLLESVRSVVTQALASVVEQRQAGAQADAKLVAELSRISAEVVRPLSHSVYEQAALFENVDTPSKRPKIRFTRAIVLATLTEPFRPVVLSIVLLLLVTPVAFVAVDPATGWATVAGLVLWTLGSLEFARVFIAPAARRFRFLARVAIILAVYLSYSLVTSMLLNYLTNIGAGFGGSAQTLYIILLALPLLSVLALTPGVREARKEVLSDLEANNRELSWLSARLSAELWADRRAIAKSLHQDVQGVLIAAAFRLQRALDRGENIAEATDEVYEIMAMAANFVVSPSEPATMAFAVENLKDRWNGILEISYEATAEAASLVSQDRIVRQLLQEILGEFAVNSVKHGLASTASVVLTADGSRTLQLEFENNGIHISDEVKFDGLGSRMMVTMGVNGRFENLPGIGVRLYAEIPVAAN